MWQLQSHARTWGSTVSAETKLAARWSGVLIVLEQRFSNFFQVGTTFISQNVLRTTFISQNILRTTFISQNVLRTTFISQNVLRTTLLLGLSNSLGLP